MPKVKQVVAAKDYPKFGIVKGQKHYHWKLKTGPRSSREFRQIEPPRPDQLTTSSYKIAIAEIEKAREDVTTYEDISGIVEMVQELADEQRGKYDNMPENFQQGDTGQTLEQQAETLEAAVSELEEIAQEWEEALNEHTDAVEKYETEKAAYDEAMVEYNAAYEAWENDETNELEEPEEPEEPEHPGEVFEDDEYIGRVNDVQLEN